MRRVGRVAFGCRRWMRRLGAAGLVAASIGAVTAAHAQQPPLTNDQIIAHSDRIFVETDTLERDARSAQMAGDCTRFYRLVNRLIDMRTMGDNWSLGQRSPSLAHYFRMAQGRGLALRDEGCPKRSAVTVALSGGASRATVPQINGGTRFDPFSATEIPIVGSARTLNGGGGSFFVTAPTPTNVLWGDYFYVGGSGSWFNGDANGSVPVGATGVAQTYIIPNPASGSTGIFAGSTGQTVQIDTDGHVIDVSLGLQNRLPGFPNTGALPLFGDPRFHVTTGFRYRNIDLSHRIAQQSLTFAGLNSQINLDQNSNFFGAQFGFGFTTAPPGAEPGFLGSIDGFVAPGVLVTSGTATQNSNCVPCGGGSPEFAVSLQRDFDNSNFSVIVGGSGSVGYRFNANVTASVFGTIEYMSGVPTFNVPTTPTQQPINLDGSDEFTNMTVGARLRIVFAYR